MICPTGTTIHEPWAQNTIEIFDGINSSLAFA